MVGVVEGTVGNFEKTVAFIKATNFLKEEKGVKFLDIGKMIGLNKGQMNMVRIKRRYVTRKEIDTLLQAYPDVAHFFNNEYAKDYEDKITDNEKLHEPMVTQFYGKNKQEPWHELVETQRKLIARLEAELEEVKGKLKEVEGQNKALEKIVSQLK